MALMRGLSPIVALIGLIISNGPCACATYGEPTPDNYCFYACHDALGYVTFNVSADAVSTDYYEQYCSNTLQIRSTYYCAQKYCSDSEIESGIKLLSGQCVEHAGYALPTFESVTLSAAALANIPVVNSAVETTSIEDPLTYPIVPDAAWLDADVKTITAFYRNWWISYDFSWSLYGFWGLVLLIGMVHRVIEVSNASRTAVNKQTKASTSAWLWVRRALVLPATFGKHCQDPVGWCTIPPRLESVLLGMYILLNIVYLFPGYSLLDENVWYLEKRLQLARYLSDRTGMLSIIQLPFLWVFSSRNDPFLWLTGWSFATYNRFHRWIARIATFHAVVHSIGWSVFEVYEGSGGYVAAWSEQYWYCGGIATTVVGLILVASVYGLRDKFYDLFLMLHIGFAVIFLVTLWYHVKIFDGEFNGFIWPCVAIWALDRFLRLGRMVWGSVLPRFTKGVRATATYNKDSEMVRLDITDFFPSKKIMPGTFYYLYAPGAIQGYESHPFTLCSWRRRLPTSPSESTSPRFRGGKEVEPAVRRVTKDTELGESNHTLLIRPYGGFTSRLRKQISAHDESAASVQVTIFLEGPYGNGLDLSGYSDVLVIAGGSGITAAISHSHHLLASGSTRVHIVWAVAQYHLVNDVCEHELAGVLDHERLDLTVYLTGAAEGETSLEKISPHEPFQVQFGRPDIERVMRENRERSDQSLAVVTCGTPQISDICRAACVRLLAEPGPDVGYYNETMLW